jgi:hypothetical protein
MNFEEISQLPVVTFSAVIICMSIRTTEMQAELVEDQASLSNTEM